MKKYRIIDFHTHPFWDKTQNICSHIESSNMSVDNTLTDCHRLGIEHICGAVINTRAYAPETITWDYIKGLNDQALSLRDYYKGFYVPGFHIHSGYVKESIAEIERMHKLGVRLIGELVPHMHGWEDYNDKDFWDIMEAAEHYDMVVSIHGAGAEKDDSFVSHFKKLKIVGAHPGEMWDSMPANFKRMEQNENYYLDWSGTGLFRHGALRHAIDLFGKERNLFGSDFPTCNLPMFVGGVTMDYLLTEEEKDYVLYKNAARLLNL